MAGKRKTARKAGRKKKKQQTPGWVWLFTGLAIGLSIAAAIYIQDRGGASAVVKKASEALPERKSEPRQSAKKAEKKKGVEFTFYDDLPNNEVIIPEEDFEVRRNQPETEIQAPGSYILQVGSFSSSGDAEWLKANLALMGLPAHIQKVSVDSRNYHRVRIGPVNDLDELNRTRAQLIEADIQAMIIRVDN